MRSIDDVLNELRGVLARKNADYGDAAFISPIFAPSLSPSAGILVRMSDKVRRLETLTRKGDNGAQVDETVEDTVLDLAGYCVLYLAQRRAERSKDERVT